MFPSSTWIANRSLLPCPTRVRGPASTLTRPLRLNPRRAPGWLVAAAIATHTLHALAQSTPSDDLFIQGRALMEQGRTRDACEKFAESLALERRGGTLLNLAVCRDKEGRRATALRLLYEARERATRDRRPERIALADELIAKVLPQLSWLEVRLASGDAPPDLVVQRDGEDLPRGRWGALEAVDPGPHTVTAMVPGRAHFEATVIVGEAGDTQLIEIPAPSEELWRSKRQSPPGDGPARWVLSPSAASTQADPVQPTPGAATHSFSAAYAPAPPSAPPAWLRPVGWTSAGLGVAAAATGSVFGVLAIRNIAASDPLCGHDVCTTRAAFQQNQDAHVDARVADVAIPVGLAAAAAGLYLLLRPPARGDRPERSGLLPTAPEVALSVASGALRGVW